MGIYRFIIQQALVLVVTVLLIVSGLPADALQESTPLNKELFHGLGIPTYVWARPNSKPDAIIVGFHGALLHGRSYETLATELARQNLMFVSFDMRGFGKWYHERVGTKKDRTFNYETSLADGQKILRRLRSAYPGTPIFCLGESLGANMSLLLASRTPTLVDGLVLVSPDTRTKFFLSPRMMVNAFQVITNPTHKFTPYIRNRLASKPVAEEHLRDQNGRNRHSIRELAKTLRFNLKGRGAVKRVPRNLHVLVIAGCKDKFTSWKGARNLFKKLPTPNKQFIVIPTSGHLIVETPYIERPVVTAISSWIRQRTPTRLATKPTPLL